MHAQSNTSTNGRNVTYPPNVHVGAVASLVELRQATGSGHPVAALQIAVGQRPQDGASYDAQRACDCRTGQQLTVGTLRLHVLHVWQRPGTSHDAVDLRVTPAR